MECLSPVFSSEHAITMRALAGYRDRMAYCRREISQGRSSTYRCKGFLTRCKPGKPARRGHGFIQGSQTRSCRGLLQCGVRGRDRWPFRGRKRWRHGRFSAARLRITVLKSRCFGEVNFVSMGPSVLVKGVRLLSAAREVSVELQGCQG